MPSRSTYFRLMAMALCATLSCVPAISFSAVKSPVHPAAKPVAHPTVVHHRITRASVLGVPTFADSSKDDIGKFDDPVVRDAALAGLGRYNGSVVALDPNNGRVLSIVNQKLAFSSGFIPCSMIKVAPRRYLNLVEALAHSNNAFFEELGRRMGFETVSHYARMMGLGELSGYQVPEEQP